ncbi:hypothetical protein AMS68_005723 [Peltaster fructicola]|uniref:Major facilitator superfamily (MFS) profile domain-containing protein n=1 Tax=Peltaster fructicola TaxID=286661 RepID=A0A6H0XZU8_9PEZI|nr:hypothetical protein AMS68_005723 [Peltaster fructicola]
MAFAAGAAKAPQHTVQYTMDEFDSRSINEQSAWKNFFNPQRMSRRWSRKPEDFSTVMVEKKGFSSEDIRLEHVDTTLTTMTAFEAQGTAAEGELYDRDGNLVLIPAPSKDPKDPLNMPFKRKFIACFCMCSFGALAAAAELILGAMLPVFALEYAHIDTHMLVELSKIYSVLPVGTDPLAFLNSLGGPPIQEIYLLASLPVLMIGLSNLVLIPLAISVGRRPVILITGAIAILGAIWAGFSTSLESHIGARVVQALGAGTVESLIPFVIQDLCFIHERNTWMSGIFAAQGIIIIAIGFASPYIIVYLSWRYVYYITSAGAGFFLIGCYFFLPETRWNRTRAEMQGIPRDDAGAEYSQPSFKDNIAMFHGTFEWMKGWHAFVDTLRTFFYPQILFITMLNSAMIGAALAAAYTAAPNLLVAPWEWSFLSLGFLLAPVLISAIFVGILTGALADKLANWAAKKRGRRIPENQLINLVLPTVVALVGCVVFGVSGSDPGHYHWAVFCMSLGLLTFGFLGANTIGAVYVLECYPHLAGPSLVNIASFRCMIAFVLSFKVSEWIVDLGYLNTMLIYTGIMAVFSMLLPVVYVFGPAWRKRWPATHFGDGRS